MEEIRYGSFNLIQKSDETWNITYGDEKLGYIIKANENEYTLSLNMTLGKDEGNFIFKKTGDSLQNVILKTNNTIMPRLNLMFDSLIWASSPKGRKEEDEKKIAMLGRPSELRLQLSNLIKLIDVSKEFFLKNGGFKEIEPIGLNLDTLKNALNLIVEKYNGEDFSVDFCISDGVVELKPSENLENIFRNAKRSQDESELELFKRLYEKYKDTI